MIVIPKGTRLEYEGVPLWLLEDVKAESPLLLAAGGLDRVEEWLNNLGQPKPDDENGIATPEEE